MADANLLATFSRMALQHGDKPFLWAKTDGEYRPWSWSRVAKEIELLAAALAAKGLQQGDRVVLAAENRPEWFISDMAIMRAGGITVPVYTTNTVDDHRHILDHSGASAAICSTPQLAKRLLPAIQDQSQFKTVIFVETYEDSNCPVSCISSWQAALELGSESPPTTHEHTIEPNDTACFIYTSGTGGRPKGVMLSHRNIMANVEGARVLLDMVDVDEDDVFLSFLPLSHSYEHTAGQFFPMSMGAQIYYAEGIESLSNNLLEARPTILPCVPRLYEVLRQKILVGVTRQGGLKEKLFRLAMDLGSRKYRDNRLPIHLSFVDRVLDKVVRTKVNERFGGRLKAMVSGGAPLNYDVGLFFVSLGLPVLQGYGQTEASPVITANLPTKSKIDSVGPPLNGVEIKIAEDGEILVRGDSVMKGYWRDDAATAATLIDGWLHTGDIGEIDEDGFLKITDRKKDIIVNSGGDNISPQRIEGVLLLAPEIAQAIVVGDQKPYLVALIVPDHDYLRNLIKNLPTDDAKSAIDKAISNAVKTANTTLSSIEKIRRFKILDNPFSTENGLMTPTLKPRRALIVSKYSDEIETLFRVKKT